MASNVRQNYDPECEKGVNAQIQSELEAMYTYISMATHFDRHDQALQGFSKYFSKAAQKKMEDVETFSTYQNKRGGKITYKDIRKPAKDDWGTGTSLYISMADVSVSFCSMAARMEFLYEITL